MKFIIYDVKRCIFLAHLRWMEMDESEVLVSGAVEVHLFGYYTIVFVSGDSV